MGYGVRVVLILLAALVLIATYTYSSIASAETYTQRPYYVIYWNYSVDPGKAYFTNLAWSPEGDKLAAVARTYEGGHVWLMVFTFEGDLMWRKDLGRYGINDPGPGIRWSIDDERLAIALIGYYSRGDKLAIVNADTGDVKLLRYRGVRAFDWSPRTPDLLVIGLSREVVLVNASSEKELWRAEIPAGARIYGVAWSPRGDLIALNTGNNVVFLDSSSGRVVAKYSAGKEAIEDMKWSSDGKLLALKQKYATENRIVVIDAAGKVKWSTKKGIILDYAWSPAVDWLAVAETAKLTLYTENGEVHWSVTTRKLRLVTYYRVAWRPDGKALVALANRFVLLDPLLHPEMNGILWNVPMVLPQNFLVGWSKLDRILVLSGTQLRGAILPAAKIAVFGPAKTYSVIIVKNCPASLLCSLVISDDKATQTYQGTRSGVLRLYATPGEYTLVFRIGALPRGYKVAGTVTDLEKYTASIKLSVEPDKTYTVEAPLDKIVEKALRGLSRLVVRAAPGITLELVRPSAEYNLKYKFKLTNSEETIYLAPGTYIVKYYPPGSLEPKVLRTIRAKGGETITLTIPVKTSITTSTPQTTSTATETSASYTEPTKTTSSQATKTTSTKAITTTTTTLPATTSTQEQPGKKKSQAPLALLGLGALAIIILAVLLATRKH